MSDHVSDMSDLSDLNDMSDMSDIVRVCISCISSILQPASVSVAAWPEYLSRLSMNSSRYYHSEHRYVVGTEYSPYITMRF